MGSNPSRFLHISPFDIIKTLGRCLSMHLCYIANPNSVHTLRWVQALHHRGYKITLLSPRPCLKPTIAAYVDLIDLSPTFTQNSRVQYLLVAAKIRRTVHQLSPDILHAHYASGYGFLGQLCNYSPYIISVWGSDVFSFPRKSLLHRYILSANLNAADYIASTSQVMAQETSQYLNTKREIQITPFGVDTHYFSPPVSFRQSDNGDLTIGSIKSLEPVYGMTKLVHAFITLAPRYPKLRLLLVGDGSQQSLLKSMIASAGLAERAQIVPSIPHDSVPQYLAQIDIFVVPSNQESFGVSALEASSSMLPVIASDVGGLPEVVVDSETGFLFDAADVDQLIQKLVVLIENPSLRRAFGQQGRQFVQEQYEWQDCVTRMCDLYARIQHNPDS